MRDPPSPLRKAEKGLGGPGPGGRVHASFGRVRWQVGGKLDDTYGCQTDEKTRDTTFGSPGIDVMSPAGNQQTRPAGPPLL